MVLASGKVTEQKNETYHTRYKEAAIEVFDPQNVYFATWNVFYYFIFHSPARAHGLATLRNKRLTDAVNDVIAHRIGSEIII